MSDDSRIKIAILGAGSRGWNFSRLIKEVGHMGVVVAVAEPREQSRNDFAKLYQIPPERVFKSWQDFAASPKLCDAVVISTMDREHAGPAIACLEKGYHLLLEKPLAVNLEDCQAIEAAQRKSGSMVTVCHSLRYNKGFAKVKSLVDSGRIGKLISVDQLEQVGYFHYAHSYVRGNWANEAKSSSMLLAKSCHDIDYISYLVGKPCVKVSSFGSLTHFKKENAPAGSTERCSGGCAVERSCAFSAVRLYVEGDMATWLPTPVQGLPPAEAREARLESIKTGPYGVCVYHADNDVVDHQVVLLEYEGGATVTFSMMAFTPKIARRIRVHGTEGQLEFEEGGQAPGDRIVITTFADNNVENIHVVPEPGSHGGGDNRVVFTWLEAIRTKNPGLILTNAQESLRTHSIVFAAEKARHENRLVELKEIYG
jgi:predicted dehydrogenase